MSASVPPDVRGETTAGEVGGRRAPWIDQRELRPVVPQGRRALLLVALVIGVLMLGIQLWLLTVALDLYLGGHGRDVWTLALFSGLIFAGGVLADRFLGRRPRAR